MSESVLAGVQQVMRDAFGNPALVIDASTTAEDVDGWDSLAHAHLIVALEKRFGIEFPAERLFDLNNVGELVELIAASRGATARAGDGR